MQLLTLCKMADIDLTDIQPFIFKSKQVPMTEIPEYGDDILASPFPVFSIEVDGGNLTGGEAEISCVVCRELKPDEYQFTILASMAGQKRVIHFDKSMPGYQDTLNLVHIFLERLYSDNQADTKYPGKARYKNSKGKKALYKPNDVIYVSSDKIEPGSKNSQGGNLVARSAWLVRSHWRRLVNPESIGMNRIGKRKTIGYTWLGTYEKGKGQMKPKIRVVK